jgi:hypothetical protein
MSDVLINGLKNQLNNEKERKKGRKKERGVAGIGFEYNL